MAEFSLVEIIKRLAHEVPQFTWGGSLDVWTCRTSQVLLKYLCGDLLYKTNFGFLFC